MFLLVLVVLVVVVVVAVVVHEFLQIPDGTILPSVLPKAVVSLSMRLQAIVVSSSWLCLKSGCQ